MRLWQLLCAPHRLTAIITEKDWKLTTLFGCVFHIDLMNSQLIYGDNVHRVVEHASMRWISRSWSLLDGSIHVTLGYLLMQPKNDWQFIFFRVHVYGGTKMVSFFRDQHEMGGKKNGNIHRKIPSDGEMIGTLHPNKHVLPNGVRLLF